MKEKRKSCFFLELSLLCYAIGAALLVLHPDILPNNMSGNIMDCAAGICIFAGMILVPVQYGDMPCLFSAEAEKELWSCAGPEELDLLEKMIEGQREKLIKSEKCKYEVKS